MSTMNYPVHGLLIPVVDISIIVRVCILRFLPHPQIWHQYLGLHWAFGQLAKGLTQGQEFLLLSALILDVSVAARWSIRVAWLRLAILFWKGPDWQCIYSQLIAVWHSSLPATVALIGYRHCINEWHGCVPIKLYLQNLQRGRRGFSTVVC